MATEADRLTPLDSFVSKDAPICYGILIPGNNHEGGVPVVKVKNIIGGSIDESTILLTSPEIHKQYRRSELNQGDLLLTIRGSTGRVALVPNSLAGANITQDTARIRVSTDDSADYLYYALQSPMTQRQIELNTVGQAVKGINIAEVKKLLIFHPSKATQTKIAQILSTWDKAIATTERLLANSQQQKQALMQQLLTGRKRLPGVSGHFRLQQFSELLDIDRKSLGSKTPEDFEFKYISLSDVNSGNISDNLESHKFKDAPSRARRLISPGDILLATVRPNLQGFAKVKKQHDGLVASTGFSVLTPKEGICGDYVYHYIFSPHITEQINALVVGSNYPAINSSDVANLSMHCPDYKEQVAIARVLNNCDATISAQQKQLACLNLEKKALMQQLLTGQRRVRLDDEVEEKPQIRRVG